MSEVLVKAYLFNFMHSSRSYEESKRSLLTTAILWWRDLSSQFAPSKNDFKERIMLRSKTNTALQPYPQHPRLGKLHAETLPLLPNNYDKESFSIKKAFFFHKLCI